MKSILLSLLFLFIPKLCFSQVITANDDAVYLDSLFNMGTEKNYKYIRVVKDYNSPNQESYEVKDFYKSGKIAMSGTSSTKDKITKTGTFFYYYENGNKKATSNFVKDRPNGNDLQWYENGNKKQDGEYIIDDKKNKSEYKINQFWDINQVQKVINGNGNFEESDKKYFGTGNVKDGFKDGAWQGWQINPKNKYTENYGKGKFISGIIVDENNIESVYDILETKPKPEKGMVDFYNHIGRNFNKSNLPKGVSGKIYIKFIIDKDGQITEPKVLRGIGYSTDQEAIRVILKYGHWIPGEQRGQKVRTVFSLPISIQTAQ